MRDDGDRLMDKEKTMGDESGIYFNNARKATDPKYTKTGQAYLSSDERKKKKKLQKKARKKNR